ncbi:MAG: response regulator [Spirochaetaceae bacterium]|nr:response regulator [Spirochaetaceae bacterium]MBR3814136.1 response regulator [Spirochaetaceae bacterium]
MASIKKNVQPLILAVDDDSVIRIHVKSSLKADYQVVSMGSAKEALIFLGNNDIDLIILDIDMPEISGFEMYDAIKKNAKTKNIPIIFLTGVEDEEILEKVKSLNEDYIEKPISTDALLMHVKKLLKK